LEYDVEIKHAKLIKGKGVSQMMYQSNFELLGVNFIVDLSKYIKEKASPQLSQIFLDSSWYSDIIFVLQNLKAPLEL
jgi:hypothetical protein